MNDRNREPSPGVRQLPSAAPSHILAGLRDLTMTPESATAFERIMAEPPKVRVPRAAASEPLDALQETVAALGAALDADITANASRDSAVADHDRRLTVVETWQANHAEPAAGELPPFVVATMRALGAAILAGGGAAMPVAWAGADGKLIILAFCGGALGAFGWRGPVEGTVDQKAAK